MMGIPKMLLLVPISSSFQRIIVTGQQLLQAHSLLHGKFMIIITMITNDMHVMCD